MQLFKLNDFTRGWFVGNFEPAILKTESFEVGILSHKKDEVWPKHYHALATEYNVLLEGEMTILGEHIMPGTIFVISPNEVADPKFLQDCRVLTIKLPSIPGDKYLV